MGTEQRSRTTRALAEAALVRLVEATGPRSGQLVVVGGLVPEYLTSDSPVEHQGTADVDIVLSVGFVYDRDEFDFSWLEDGLRSAKFKPDPKTPDGWRWVTTVDGQLIKVEFLCDIAGDLTNHVIPLPGCRALGASNLKGPGAAIKDPLAISLGATDDRPQEVTVQVAGLGGYILSKASAAASRGLERDFYDFAYVLIFNDQGGPSAAALAVETCAERVRDRVGTYEAVYFPRLREAIVAFVEAERPGAQAYATERQRTGATEDFDQLVEDATSAALEFFEQLTGSSGPVEAPHP